MDIKLFLIGSALLTIAWIGGLAMMFWSFWPVL